MEFFSYKHPSVRLTGRWDKTKEAYASATAPGSYIELAYKGDILQLVFDLECNELPLPHLYVQIDGGAMQETVLDKRLRYITKGSGEHTCRIIYKSSTEALSRWRMPVHNAISFCGFAADAAGELPADNRKTVEFVGDSITEGVLVDIDYAKAPACDIDEHNRPYQDDATATYAWIAAELLDLRPVICGYGAVGLTRPGKGRVPAAVISYPYNFEGSPITHGPSDIVVLNHGANDRIHSCEEYLARYGEMLKILRSYNPNALIVSLSAFCGAFGAELKEFISKYNADNNEDIRFVDTAGWVPKEPLHPLRPGHRLIGEKLAEQLKGMIK